MIKILLTGPPGSGKTTAVMKVYETLKLYNYSVGGFITREERKNNVRIGFNILILDTGETYTLASVYLKEGPRIGKYRVNVEALDKYGIEALKRALNRHDVIIIDEIGPMELTSKNFLPVLSEVFKSNKPTIATIHYKIASNIPKELKTDKESVLYYISEKNRDAIPLVIWRKLKQYLKKA